MFKYLVFLGALASFIEASTALARRCSTNERAAFTGFLTKHYHAKTWDDSFPRITDFISIFQMKVSTPVIHSSICLFPECTEIFQQISLAPAFCPNEHDFALPNCSISSSEALPYRLKLNRTMLRTVAEDVLQLCSSHHRNESIPEIPFRAAHGTRTTLSVLSLTIVSVVSFLLV